MKKLLSLVLLSTVSLASPPADTPTQREILHQWYCGYCFTAFRNACADCYEWWGTDSQMALRCINGRPRQEFLECIALCPFSPSIYGDILSLYDDGLLDSWGVVEAIQALQ